MSWVRPSYCITQRAASAAFAPSRLCLQRSSGITNLGGDIVMHTRQAGTRGRHMRRLALVLLAAGVAGCGRWSRVGGSSEPKPTEGMTQFFNAEHFYQKLGRLAAGDPLPFIGNVAFT